MDKIPEIFMLGAGGILTLVAAAAFCATDNAIFLVGATGGGFIFLLGVEMSTWYWTRR